MKSKAQYLVIADNIEDQIKNNILKPKDQLPTEGDLCKQYNVSRMTVNKALASLVQKNLIYRIAGKGTFVQETKVYKEISNTKQSSFTKDIEEINQTPGCILLEYKVVKAVNYPEVSKKLHLNDDDFIHYIERIRTADDVRVALQRTFIPCRFLPALDVRVLEGSLYQYLIDYHHVVPHAIDYTFNALLPDNKLKELLQIEDVAILECSHITIDLNTNQYFEFTDTYYVGSRYTYHMVKD